MRESHRRLLAMGVDLHVLAPAWKGLSSHQIDGVPVYRFRYAPKSLEILTHDEGGPNKIARKPWLQLLAIPYLLSGTWSCLKLCLRLRPNVLHVHWPFPHGLIAWPMQRLFHIPVLLNFYGAELLLVRKRPWVAHVLTFLIRRSDGVLAISSFTATTVQKICPCKIDLIPFGTTLENFHPQPRTLSGPRPFTALFVGRHVERKGLRYLVEAAALLDPQRFQIRIVGQGDQTPTLRELAGRVAPQQVVFTGKIPSDALAQEYADADCFVLPSIVDSRGDTEGLGVVLIEAAALNLPLVASNVGGIPDIVVDGVSGLLVPEKDPQALAQALIRLASDPTLGDKLRQGARKHIEEHFSWEGITTQLMDLYQRLCRRGL
ncbi:MAG TPA: glycosyltransferase family 4 protein [Fibrobacteraceae bacterium]|nr:glycosyltransferase family 4 protein [Fibrobacteraceae bacterium]